MRNHFPTLLIRHTHIYTHTCTYACIHACTHTEIHTHVHPCMHTHMRTHMNTHMHTHTWTNTQHHLPFSQLHSDFRNLGYRHSDCSGQHRKMEKTETRAETEKTRKTRQQIGKFSWKVRWVLWAAGCRSWVCGEPCVVASGSWVLLFDRHASLSLPKSHQGNDRAHPITMARWSIPLSFQRTNYVANSTHSLVHIHFLT